MSTGRHAAPHSRRGRASQVLAPGLLLLAIAVVAVVCLVVVDELGTGGRAIGSLVALWALVMGAVSVRQGLRTRGTA